MKIVSRPFMRSSRRLAVALASLAFFNACGGGSSSKTSSTSNGSSAPPSVVTVASNLDHPWSLAFLPDGRMLVTERSGTLRVVSSAGVVSAPISGVPQVVAVGQGGLFEVLLSPDYGSTRRLYLSYAEPGTGLEAGRNGLAVIRATLKADATALEDVQVVFRQTPKVASTGHFGGRLLFAPDGKLFVSTGERMLSSERGYSQDLSKGHGKLVRINPDGSTPSDNPFASVANAQPTIWSYGHRNPQALAFHPVTGELWEVEHGPQGGDEVNVARAGRNYGWPLVSYGCEYGAPVGACPPVGGASTGAGFEPPLTYWVPTSIAPSGMAFYTGSGFPEWRGNLFIGALSGESLWRLEVTGDAVVKREELLKDLGERIRDVRQGPDGWLYLLTDYSKGRILRLQR